MSKKNGRIITIVLILSGLTLFASPVKEKHQNIIFMDGEGKMIKTEQTSETATFAAGCFWGVEHKFGKFKGVLSTAVGYSGGDVKNPTYSQVCSDATGHAEAIHVVYDPAQTNYEELVKFFFTIHDPTQLNRQGPDVGTQYRSVIFYHSREQKDTALKVIGELNKSGRFQSPIVTQVAAFSEFYKAEEYHQKYYEKMRKK
jgi:methionine-S-sulfoxide reductase